MNKIEIAYWCGKKLDGLEYEHNQIFDYSKRLRNKIIDNVLTSGYNIKIQQGSKYLIIWISDTRFTQR